MDDFVWFSEGRRRCLLFLFMKVLEGVVGEVMKNVWVVGYGEVVCMEFYDYFVSLLFWYFFFIYDYFLYFFFYI